MSKTSEKMQKIIMANPKRAVWFMTSMNPKFWEKRGERMALDVFNNASLKSPAYKKFLKREKINPKEIQTIEDFFKMVPLTSKKNYLSKYSLNDLTNGKIKESFGLCFTSGTTNMPVSMLYSKETLPSIIQGVIAYFHYLWDVSSPSVYTLYINGLALGPWLASFLSNFVLAREAEKYNFTLTTTGANPDMMLESLERIGTKYNQIVVCGYPSVLKTFLEKGDQKKIKWEKFNIKIISAGEPLSKNLKKNILDKIDPQRKNPWCILDFFATTDASVLGFGTPLAIAIEEILDKNQDLCLKIFGQKEISNLFQYNQASAYIEEGDGNIAITKPGAIPLIRYQVGDLCKVVSFPKMIKDFNEAGYNLANLLQKMGWHKGYFSWPFFSYLGRADDMVIIYAGANIYAKNLFFLLEKDQHEKEIRHFKISAQPDKNNNTRLIVYLELKSGLNFSAIEIQKIEKKYLNLIHKKLLETNIDYKDAHRLNSKLTMPIVKVFHHGNGPFKESHAKPKSEFLI